MMSIEEMRKRREELMYTYEMIAEKSSVPLSTVQKIFGGVTDKPRYKTLEALDLALKKPREQYEMAPMRDENHYVREEAADYNSDSEQTKTKVKSIDAWYGEEPSERWPRQGSYTVGDYLDIPGDIRVELIDGVIYDFGSPPRSHQRVLSHLHAMFYNCIEEHGDECELLVAPFDVRLDSDDKTMVQPDLLIVCPQNRSGNSHSDADEEARLEGAPDFIAEILSPSTRKKDCTVKLRKYMNAGVDEYWIVDPESERVMVYRFAEDYLPTQYSFDEEIPVGISGGKCSIDFRIIKEKIGRGRRPGS